MVNFFVSWQLWEKMTFVLGCAIVVVFCIGYVKLLWTNRIVRKQELVDEEKRVRIEELRRSGQEVIKKDDDVPFGVRAIQSGIQVDGIWISGQNTPVPSIHLGRQSAMEPSSVGSSSNTNVSGEPSSRPAQTPSPQPGRPGLRNSGSMYSSYRNASDDDMMASDHRGSSRQHAAYKPTRSSQLRFGTVGDSTYDEQTLGRLEGGAQTGRIYTHQPRGAYVESDASSTDAAATADNERSSGTSDDSDATFSHGRHQKSHRVHHQSQYSTRTSTPEMLSPALLPQSYQNQGKGNDQYFSLPLAADDEDVNPFTTPRLSPTERSFAPHAIAVDLRDQDHVVESQAPLLNERSQSPPFRPGELHANKSVRKINSGFEVLPAGTFGAQVDVKGKGVSRNDSSNYDNSEERKSHGNKLQKKGARFSTPPSAHQQ
ncbi:Methyltransferase type 11 protein [Rutstroemia sp. NJR-2017a WRK4]|nr:Methyltransferase type 11 protein [Rutstroemia sp. NJR-2017a WRK4]PQE14865.1 Methyltransferase type 11 protein [Rutstroemia sp. NJR-2017a WRK4]